MKMTGLFRQIRIYHTSHRRSQTNLENAQAGPRRNLTARAKCPVTTKRPCTHTLIYTWTSFKARTDSRWVCRSQEGTCIPRQKSTRPSWAGTVINSLSSRAAGNHNTQLSCRTWTMLPPKALEGTTHDKARRTLMDFSLGQYCTAQSSTAPQGTYTNTINATGTGTTFTVHGPCAIGAPKKLARPTATGNRENNSLSGLLQARLRSHTCYRQPKKKRLSGL